MATITTSQVLETLYRAHATLSDETVPYDYKDYTRCTCGHIYAAADGTFTYDAKVAAFGEDPLYVAALEAVAAIYHEPLMAGARPYFKVSHATSERAVDASFFDPDFRAAALGLVNEAIAKIEAEQEADRLDVLAQTRRIVDNAVVPVPAVA